MTLLSDVATSYIGIRTLQQQLAITADNVVKQKKALAIARDRYTGGTATKLDVFQAENVLAQTESDVPQLTAQLQQGEGALRVLLGMTPQSLDSLLTGPTTIPVPPGDVAVGIPADLIRRRPDIRSAELQAAAQSAQIGLAKADLFPAFSLTGAFGTVAASSGNNRVNEVFSARGIQFAFGPTFSWPILNYGQITNNVRVQDARLQTLLINYQNTVLKAQREGREWPRLVRARTASGRTAAPQCRGGEQCTAHRTRPVSAWNERFYHRADGGTEPLPGPDRSGDSRGQSFHWPCISLPVARRWVADTKGNEFVNTATRDEMRKRTNWGGLLPPADLSQPTPGSAVGRR